MKPRPAAFWIVARPKTARVDGMSGVGVAIWIGPVAGEAVPRDLSHRRLSASHAATGAPEVTDLRGAVDAYERTILEAALIRQRYNQRQTATALGLSYDQHRHALRKHGLLER